MLVTETLPPSLPRIAVVGPCASGKSTLVSVLRERGYETRHVAQEHSYVPYMWQRIAKPDILIYLDVDQATVQQRRPHSNNTPKNLAEQHKRLAHARQHCDLYLDTSNLLPAQVQTAVFDFLAIGE